MKFYRYFTISNRVSISLTSPEVVYLTYKKAER